MRACKAENRLLRLCKKARGAIERERGRINQHRQARKWKEEEPARLKAEQEYELKRQVFNAG